MKRPRWLFVVPALQTHLRAHAGNLIGSGVVQKANSVFCGANFWVSLFVLAGNLGAENIRAENCPPRHIDWGGLSRCGGLVGTGARSPNHGGNQQLTSGSNECTAGSTYCESAGEWQYPATPGYDEASGLGSVDLYKLLTAWPAHLRLRNSELDHAFTRHATDWQMAEPQDGLSAFSKGLPRSGE